MKHPVGQTSNGLSVFVDLIHSGAAAHISSQPYLLALAKEAMPHLTPRGAQAKVEYDMKRPIGYDFVIPTTEQNVILYAQLLHETVYTRFVKNGRPTATSYLTMDLSREADGSYALNDIWIGRISPPRPGGPSENAESRPFWANHAFVLDTQQLQARTVTRDCPY